MRYRVTTSTNDLAKAAGRAGVVANTVFMADTQTLGRGRRERSWESPIGGLWMSWLTRPLVRAEVWPVFALAAAVSVVRVLRALGVESRIKWPNDVLVCGKKVAGILCESGYSSTGEPFVVVGIGINLNVSSETLPDSLRSQATSVVDLTGVRVDIVETALKLAQSLACLARKIESGSTEHVLRAWRHNSDMLGRNVRVYLETGSISGVAEDIDETGCLLLRTDTGVVKVVAADVSLRLDAGGV